MYFHAIVSHDFGFNPEKHSVYVRGGDGLGQKGWTDACEMYYTKDLHDLGSLIEGKMDIPRQSLDKPIPYKYVIHRGKDTVEYEFIYEPVQKKGEHVNRCLQVASASLGGGGKLSRALSGSAPWLLGEQTSGFESSAWPWPCLCLFEE